MDGIGAVDREPCEMSDAWIRRVWPASIRKGWFGSAADSDHSAAIARARNREYVVKRGVGRGQGEAAGSGEMDSKVSTYAAVFV